MIGDGATTVNIFSLVGNTIRVKDAAALAADTTETYTVSDSKSSHCLWQGELKMKLSTDSDAVKIETW
jgi:hypothetical protein